MADLQVDYPRDNNSQHAVGAFSVLGSLRGLTQSSQQPPELGAIIIILQMVKEASRG